MRNDASTTACCPIIIMSLPIKHPIANAHRELGRPHRACAWPAVPSSWCPAQSALIVRLVWSAPWPTRCWPCRCGCLASGPLARTAYGPAHDGRPGSAGARRTHNAVTIGDARGHHLGQRGFTRMTGYTLDEGAGQDATKLLGGNKTSPMCCKGPARSHGPGPCAPCRVINRARTGAVLGRHRSTTHIRCPWRPQRIHGDWHRHFALKQTSASWSRPIRETQVLLQRHGYQTIVSRVDRGGCIPRVNGRSATSAATAREELVRPEPPHHRLRRNQPKEAFWESMWATISSSSWRGDICNRAKDGQLYWVDSIITPFIGDDGLVESTSPSHGHYGAPACPAPG